VNRPSAPALLSDEIEAAFVLITDLPFAGEEVRHSRIANLRRVLLGRTQYHLYYAVSEDMETVEVLSLWHTSRGRPPRI
jgi:plasmid stabilization system protein ParE